MVAKGCIVARVLPLRCFLFLLPNYTIFSVYFLFVLLSDEPEVFHPEYYQPAILHTAHFRRVVNTCILTATLFVLLARTIQKVIAFQCTTQAFTITLEKVLSAFCKVRKVTLYPSEFCPFVAFLN